MSHVQLDCIGLNCPMPIVRISQTMKTMQAGQVLQVTANDPAFGADVRAWVDRLGHRLLDLQDGETQTALIEKVGA